MDMRVNDYLCTLQLFIQQDKSTNSNLLISALSEESAPDCS